MKKIRTVHALAVTGGESRRQVSVQCPVCSETHYHGWYSGEGEPIIRGSHCAEIRKRTTYGIVVASVN